MGKKKAIKMGFREVKKDFSKEEIQMASKHFFKSI